MAPDSRTLARIVVPILMGMVLALPIAAQADAPLSVTTLEDRLEKAVREHVMEGFRQAGLKGELVAIHLPPAAEGLDPTAAIRPLRTFLPSRAAGRFVIPLEIRSHGSQPAKVNITAECVAVVEGWAVRFPLKRGTALEAKHFQRKTIRVTNREEDYFIADSLPTGYRLATGLTQGQLLQYHHFEEVTAVQPGESVMIHFYRQNITLISPGTVRREGKIGDVIPVVASATGKRLYGRLVSPGIVVVE